MEIHAPHHAIQTRKEFLIHMGTIVLGILIALCFEQSVEWLHHRHQRHRLEEQLRLEGEENREFIRNDFAIYDSWVRSLISLWQDATIETLPSSTDSSQKATSLNPSTELVADPQNPNSDFHILFPNTSTWETAKETEVFNLLPKKLSQDYTDLYRNEEVAIAAYRRFLDENSALNAFLLRLADPRRSVPFNIKSGIAHLSPADRKELVLRISICLESSRTMTGALVTYSAWNTSVLKGHTTAENIYLERERVRAEHQDVLSPLLPKLMRVPHF